MLHLGLDLIFIYLFKHSRIMDRINNNQFEVKPISKRKITVPCSNVYLNPALDLLANEDRICNTAMEIPVKKRKRTKSCDIVSFENSALDIGVKPVNAVLVREINNVRRTVEHKVEDNTTDLRRDYKDLVKDNATDFKRYSVATKVSEDKNEFHFMGDNIDDVDFTNTAENISILDGTNKEITNTDESGESETTEAIYANLENVVLHNPKSEAQASLPKTKELPPIPNSIRDRETNAAENNETKDNLLNCDDISRIDKEDAEVDSGIVVEKKPKREYNITNIQTNVTNQVVLNNSNLSLSFIDRLAIDSPNVSDRTLYFDDDLNESNIMEIKTITIITKKKRIIEKKNTNPFLNPNLDTNIEIPKINPFLDLKAEVEYQEEASNRQEEASYRQEEACNRQEETAVGGNNALMPRRLFENTNSTISTVNDSIEIQHEYENIDNLHLDPIYENIDELNKQSKLLGHDVSQFSSVDILNLKNKVNNSNESNDSKKDKSSFFKAGKLSKKVFKTLKKTFKHEKHTDVTLNPYEVPRKLPKQKQPTKESGIENPALNLDNSDDLEIEELSDEEHQYETIKTLRNTRLNMNVTPLRERNEDIDFSNRVTPSKKVRFDSSLNQEKVITGNSFDCSMASPGFDAKIDKYHDELENCINERKFLQQNM